MESAYFQQSVDFSRICYNVLNRAHCMSTRVVIFSSFSMGAEQQTHIFAELTDSIASSESIIVKCSALFKRGKKWWTESNYCEMGLWCLSYKCFKVCQNCWSFWCIIYNKEYMYLYYRAVDCLILIGCSSKACNNLK